MIASNVPSSIIYSGHNRYDDVSTLKYPLQILHYYYPINIISEEVYKRTSMIGKYAYTKEGVNLLDRLSLSPDEYDIFLQLCREASDDIYQVCFPFLAPDVDSFRFNHTSSTIDYAQKGITFVAGDYIEVLDITTGERTALYVALKNGNTNDSLLDTSVFVKVDVDLRESVHYLIHKPSWVDSNSISSTDAVLFDCLCSYIMYKWFVICSPERAEYYLSDYNNKRINLSMLLNQNGKMSVVSHPM